MTLSGDLPEKPGGFCLGQGGCDCSYSRAARTEGVQSHHDRELAKQGIVLRVMTDRFEPDGSIQNCTCAYCQNCRKTTTTEEEDPC